MCENLSIYIPIISNTTSKNFIIKQFLEHNIGKIKKIDFVLNLKKNRSEAFIHFHEWFNNDKSISLNNDIKNNNTKTRFIYNEKTKQYWPLLINKNPNKMIKNNDYKILSESEINTIYNKYLNINKETQQQTNQKQQKHQKLQKLQKTI